MTPQAMEKFRDKYRAAISPNYNGWVHMGFVLIVGISVILYCLLQIVNSSWREWLVFPLTMLSVNFAEYYAHRWLGHRKTKYGQLFYQRHSGDHHSFFLAHAMPYQSVRDWRVVLFPSYLIIAFILGLVIPGGWLLMEITTDNIAHLYGAAAISGYLFYEVMHFSYHLPTGSFVERTPIWRELRQLHVEHHKRELMTEKNFNITLPIFDWLLGTYHLPKDWRDKS